METGETARPFSGPSVQDVVEFRGEASGVREPSDFGVPSPAPAFLGLEEKGDLMACLMLWRPMVKGGRAGAIKELEKGGSDLMCSKEKPRIRTAPSLDQGIGCYSVMILVESRFPCLSEEVKITVAPIRIGKTGAYARKCHAAAELPNVYMSVYPVYSPSCCL